MVARNHNNRSEKQKGHVPVEEGVQAAASHEGHQGSERARDRTGTDERHDGKSRQNGGGDGAGGAPKQQGQGQANKGVDNQHQNRGHG
ncbi:MAG: hypothetical protein JWR08_2080 [Enterovirga sp.]|jgi:hypothetical protein|nr:hypothetical protein [Enterovirga sp.]